MTIPRTTNDMKRLSGVFILVCAAGLGGKGGSNASDAGTGGAADSSVPTCSSVSPKYTLSYPTPNGPFDVIKLPAGNPYYLGDNVWGPFSGVTNVRPLSMWAQSESCWGVVADDPVNTDMPTTSNAAGATIARRAPDSCCPTERAWA